MHERRPYVLRNPRVRTFRHVHRKNRDLRRVARRLGWKLRVAEAPQVKARDAYNYYMPDCKGWLSQAAGGLQESKLTVRYRFLALAFLGGAFFACFVAGFAKCFFGFGAGLGGFAFASGLE